ncbi:MAG: AAA family ATPase, partial [Bacteroidales bacterium]|nr:AAA family ATPase [Bacteroidales bacterium]
MLKHLYIQNYILIDKLSIDFHSGFSIVTGETGAGKSIFLGALSLLLGNRASGKINKVEREKTILEATFAIQDFHLKPLFEENDLDYTDETIIRREILPNGKTRGFINDTPVNVSALKIIGDHLLDIHSQNDNLWLNNPEFQLSILDSLADTDALLTTYQTKLSQYTQAKQALSML